MIEVGQRLPDLSLTEYNEVEGVCAIGPVAVPIWQSTQGKTIAIFGVPGAFTPTCSEQHLPGFLEDADAFKAAGVDEIWCISVNDPFVMGAWAKASHSEGKIRMLADGSGDFAKATGLTLDLSGHGLGMRSTRYSMLVKDGLVLALNNDGGPQLATSDAQTLLKQAQALKA